MKLLFLCKRRPMDRDLVDVPYGRFANLPKILAERGHHVSIVLLDYKNSDELRFNADGIHWISSPVAKYLAAINTHITNTRPDWVVGFSDTYFGVLAAHFARKHGMKSCIDAYDNYESYIRWAKPLHWLWRSALRKVDLVTAAGPGLAALMRQGLQEKDSAVVPMAADPIGFEPRDRRTCRKTLKLPTDAPLVGYCGSLHSSRGVEVFFDAIPLVLAKRPEIRFVHSGRTWSDVPLPETLESLGYIDDEDVPVLLNSMNVLVAVNRESSFGHYSYPVKLYEAMSCQIPVVATRTRATEWILENHPDSLVRPADPQALCDAILHALTNRDVKYQSVPTWATSCDIFEAALMKGLETNRAR